MVPPQRSANGTRPSIPAVEPTAMQKRRVTHATPLNPLAGPGTGVRWIDHFDPFQRSASNTPPPMNVLGPML
jgi:hypothetical protein